MNNGKWKIRFLTTDSCLLRLCLPLPSAPAVCPSSCLLLLPLLLPLPPDLAPCQAEQIYGIVRCPNQLWCMPEPEEL